MKDVLYKTLLNIKNISINNINKNTLILDEQYFFIIKDINNNNIIFQYYPFQFCLFTEYQLTDELINNLRSIEYIYSTKNSILTEYGLGYIDGLNIIKDNMLIYSIGIGSSIPNNIYKICDNAFIFSSIKSLQLNDNINKISPLAFSSLDNNIKNIQTSIDLSKLSITYTPIDMCLHSSNIQNVLLPDTVNIIYESSFKGCLSLTSINIPSNIKTIDHTAFSTCSSLLSINLPHTTININQRAFENCYQLSSISLSNTCISQISYKMFSNCYNLLSIVCPTSLTAINDYAFENCYNLLSIQFNNNIEYINEYAFYNCQSLSIIDLTHTNIKYIGYNAFGQCKNLKYIKLPYTIEQSSLSNNFILNSIIGSSQCNIVFS